MTHQGNLNIRAWNTKRIKKQSYKRPDQGTCPHTFVQISMKWKHCIRCKRFVVR